MKTMESITIPVFADKVPCLEARVDLSGKRYGFYISYNALQEAWFMALSDPNDKLLIAGIRLVQGIDLLAKYRASVPELPLGELWVIDVEGQNNEEITRHNLGTKFVLTYTVFGEE
jgi:hypothetical protein